MFERRYFVVAPSFHGATLLAKLLNAHPEVVSLGDTYPSNRYDQVCGCGCRVSQCPFWQKVFKSLGDRRDLVSSAILPYYPPLVTKSIDPLLYCTLPISVLKKILPIHKVESYAEHSQAFLQSIYDYHSESSPNVFVDGVKLISRVNAMLATGEKVDGVIHLVRSPEDFVKSYMKQRGDSLATLAKASIGWRLYHRMSANLKQRVPYLCISYEQLATDTDRILAELFQFLNVPQMNVNALSAYFDHEWHFMGNASLFDFDGGIRPRRYNISLHEARLVRVLSGGGRKP